MMMVKSANDMAVLLAEGISGSIDKFAEQMTLTAQTLGMTESNFVNPNGLPADGQITSARDLAILARALIRDFPQYSFYWHIPAIQFGKRVVRNYNPLIGRYPGTDGMKTGFICASGFNLVATATRDNKHLIAVVLGAPSGAARAVKAAEMLESGFTSNPLAWLMPSLGTVDQLKPIHTDPPNLKDEMCGRHRKRPASDDEDEEAGAAEGNSGTPTALPRRCGDGGSTGSNVAAAMRRRTSRCCCRRCARPRRRTRTCWPSMCRSRRSWSTPDRRAFPVRLCLSSHPRRSRSRPTRGRRPSPRPSPKRRRNAHGACPIAIEQQLVSVPSSTPVGDPASPGFTAALKSAPQVVCSATPPARGVTTKRNGMDDKMTIPALQQMKRDGKKSIGVVAWDYQIARIADRAGVDFVSVGDSVGVNLWGRSEVSEVTMDEMLICCKAVRAGVERALVSCDMPYGPVQEGIRQLRSPPPCA